MILKEGGRINSHHSTYEQGFFEMLNLSSPGGGPCRVVPKFGRCQIELEFEFNLVPDRDTVDSEEWNRWLEDPGALNCTRVNGNNSEPAFLIEPESRVVVIGCYAPQA